MKASASPLPVSYKLAVLLLICWISAISAGQIDSRPEWCKSLPRPVYRSLERVLTEELWFEVYRVRPGVFAIYEPHQFEEVISYLIVGSKQTLLLDTGMGIGSIRNLVKKLTPLPVTVLNTHSHPDHIGGNADFQDVWALDRGFTRQNSKGYSHALVKEWISAKALCGDLPAGFDPKSYAIRPFQITKFIKDGDEMDLGERKVRILETPGHTPDSLCLLDEKNGLLFTGDSFYPGPIYLFAQETDFPAYIKSVEKLAALANKIDVLLPAHNEPVASPLFLQRLQMAVRDVQSGAAKPKSKDGSLEYTFEGFSLILAGR